MTELPDRSTQELNAWSTTVDDLNSYMQVGNIGKVLLYMPLLNSLSMPIGLGVVTFTRASAATLVDRYRAVQDVGVDIARFEKNGLLMEGARTNVLQQNNDLTQAIWSKVRASVTGGATTGPDGVAASADKLVEDGTASNNHYITQPYAGFADNAVVSISACFKAAERSWVSFRLVGKDSVSHFVYLNLATGAVGTLNSVTASQVGVITLADGWCKLIIDGIDIASGGGTPAYQIILADADGSASYNGDGSSGIYISRAQLEVGAFASSEIPTVGTTVTRLAETCQIDIVGNIPLQANPCAILMDIDIIGTNGVGGANQEALLIPGESNRIIRAARNAVSGQAFTFYGDKEVDFGVSLTPGTVYRLGLVHAGSGAGSGWLDGVSKGTFSGADVTDSLGTSIQLGGNAGSWSLFGHISNLRIYEGALSDRELAVS